MKTVLADARHYARIRYRLILIDLLGSLLFLWLYQVSGISLGIARWGETLTPFSVFRVGVYLGIFSVCSYLVFFPLHLYSGFFLEHRFGLSRLTLKAWGIRELKQLVLSAAFGLLVMEGLYALLRHAPMLWVPAATIGWVLVSVVLARVFPTWIVPLFYKTSPLADDALARRLLSLCERARLSVLGVFRVGLGVETRKANAALAGFGRTRRVLISDTLLERFTPEEIETVLAHELGHQRYRHITKLLLLSAVGSLIAFSLVDLSSRLWLSRYGLRSLADVAGFPMLMLSLSLIGLIGLPLQQAISRHFEWQSDRFAVTLTGQPAAFAAALRKLGELNLADPNPPAWVEVLLYDHPALPKRIRAAEAIAASS